MMFYRKTTESFFWILEVGLAYEVSILQGR